MANDSKRLSSEHEAGHLVVGLHLWAHARTGGPPPSLVRVVLQPSGLWEGDTEWEDEINRPEYSGEDRLAYVVAGRHGEHLRRQDARKDTVDHFMVYATLPPMAVKKDSDEDLVLRATAPAGQHRRALVEAAVACVHEVLLLHRTTWSDVADAIEKHETLEWGQLQPLVRSIVA